MTEDSRRRLQAIKEFSDLGSGFRIAAMDLEIRGAGNLLGGQQSGHIEAVGFELYNRILDRTIREFKGEVQEKQFETEFNLNLDLHIPEDYIKDTGERMRYYKMISEAENHHDLVALEEKLQDYYGHTPDSVKALFKFASISQLTSAMKIEKVDRKADRFMLKFSPESEINSQHLAEMVAAEQATFSPQGVLTVAMRRSTSLEMLEDIYRCLHSLSS